jgi:cobalamin biosynthesis Mg chelatase CobN
MRKVLLFIVIVLASALISASPLVKKADIAVNATETSAPQNATFDAKKRTDESAAQPVTDPIPTTKAAANDTDFDNSEARIAAAPSSDSAESNKTAPSVSAPQSESDTVDTENAEGADSLDASIGGTDTDADDATDSQQFTSTSDSAVSQAIPSVIWVVLIAGILLGAYFKLTRRSKRPGIAARERRRREGVAVTESIALFEPTAKVF